MRKTEIPHNSPEQTLGYLRAALAVVEELDPPEDLRVPLFVQACQLASAKQLFFEQPQPVSMPAMAIPRNQR